MYDAVRRCGTMASLSNVPEVSEAIVPQRQTASYIVNCTFSPLLDFHKIATQCQHVLVEKLVPFWLEHACDGLCGGYFDHLTPEGSPIDADKCVARQAEQVWAFAYLYTAIDAQSDWLDHALHGADFLAQHAHTSRMTCYTYLNRTGQPVAPLNGPTLNDPLTSARVASAYVQTYLATNNDEWAMLAKQTLNGILRHYQRTREKALAAPLDEPQPLRYLGQPVALLRALLDARPLFAPADWKETAEPLLDEILNEFLDKRHDLLRDYVAPGGAFSNTPDGRRISTGLTMETASLLIEVGTLLGNRKLVLQAANWVLRFSEWAWPMHRTGEKGAAGTSGKSLPDKMLPSTLPDGLPRYLDWKGQPSVFPNASHRLAGDHALALAALANGYWHTRHPDAPRWLKRLADYTFTHFADLPPPQDRCYPLVRGLADTWQHLDQCARLQPVGVK